MGYQERRVEFIAKRAAPHLEPGETIQTGFIAQTRFLFSPRHWAVVVTDRAILVVDRRGAQRLPRDIRFGEPTGMYHEIHLDRAYRVHRQYFAEVTAADAALREMRDPGRPAE
jgi:hypothetical protein